MILRLFTLCIFSLLFAVQSVCAQELEPRRWTHLPVGVNFMGFGYAYTDADIAFDPSLQIEDARGDIHTAVFSYVRTLDVFGKSGRIDVLLPYSNGRWEGLLEGSPASTRRSGFNDPKVRFAVNLLGSPVQSAAQFSQFKVNTIVGAGVEVTVPVGEYQSDKLINLGGNRWIVRPQLGVVHNWDKWAAEVTGSVWFFSDNDEFSVDNTREQDELFALQTHLIYTFRPGLWASLSGAFGSGAQSSINGVEKGDDIGKFLYAASFGFPLNRKQGVKLSLMGGSTTKDTGDDFRRILVAYSMMWGG